MESFIYHAAGVGDSSHQRKLIRRLGRPHAERRSMVNILTSNTEQLSRCHVYPEQLLNLESGIPSARMAPDQHGTILFEASKDCKGRRALWRPSPCLLLSFSLMNNSFDHREKTRGVVPFCCISSRALQHDGEEHRPASGRREG